MTATAPRTLTALAQAAVDATGAAQGWIVAAEAGMLRVVAVIGPDPGRLLGAQVSGDAGTCGFVVASGQPVALRGGSDDSRLAKGVAALAVIEPRSVLCVPCGTDDAILGALEVVDKAGEGAFTFDDVELVSLLGVVVGAALAELTSSPDVPSPADLASDLSRLAAAEPGRYAAVAVAIAALLADG